MSWVLKNLGCRKQQRILFNAGVNVYKFFNENQENGFFIVKEKVVEDSFGIYRVRWEVIGMF